MTILRAVRADIGLFARLYNNGSKGMVAACVFAIGSGLFLSASLIMSFVLIPDKFEPLDNPVPQHVLNPVVEQGGILSVDAVKCNHSDEPVAIESTAVFRDLSNRDVFPFREGFGARDVGCTELHYDNPIPASLPPGRYRVEGIDVTRKGELIQQEPWFSEPFIVLERVRDE